MPINKSRIVVYYYKQLKEERPLTQSAVDDVVSGCREVFLHTSILNFVMSKVLTIINKIPLTLS